jgi:soluble epoxide hydrolase/lipid-phosphate phosphatase
MVDKITPNDSRITYKTANLNGVTYSYILSEPVSGKVLDTIFLIHGWPDLSLGWRYQIPFLTSLGLRVVALDMMGYGGTDAPSSPTFYTYKRAADDIAELAKQLGLSSIILGGHDWGGAVVYRVAMRYPKLISAVISVCTPFGPPRKDFLDAGAVMPNFKYQLQLRGPEVQATIVGEEKLRQFLNGMYGGRTPAGETTFDVSHGCFFDRLENVGKSPILNQEEMDWYVKRYAIHGMEGPLNWYRTGKLNHEDELDFVANIESLKFEMPVLFISASKDAALPPAMSKGMEQWFKSLSRGEVDANHWALWEKPAEVNQCIKEFLEKKVINGSKL